MRAHTDESGTASVASLIAESTRSAVLWMLSDGRSLAAGELARLANVSPATMSEHLSKLVNGDLVRVERCGRHAYYRISGPEVVRVLERLATLDARSAPDHARPADTAIRLARTCYDHLAGSAGVAITNALVKRRYLVETESGYDVSKNGEDWFAVLGVSVPDARLRATETRRQFARACLDWSERRHHLAGELGARLCARTLELGWFERRRGTRALRVTAIGRRRLKAELDVRLF